jgi:hypothetical protein
MPASVPESGRFELELDAAYGNTFSHTWHARALHVERGLENAPFTREEAEVLHARHPQDVIAFVDGEVTRVALRAALGIGRGASVSLEVPWISFGALHLDGAIESFHGAFGLSASQRGFFPRGRFAIVQQRPGGGLEYQDETPRAGLGDAVLYAQLFRETDAGTRLGAQLAVKLPTGDADEWRGSGSFDAGILFGASRDLSRRLAARIETGAVLPGRFRGRVAATFRPSPFLRLLGAIAWRPGPGTSLWAAAVLEQSPERRDDRGDAGRTGAEVALGVAWRVGRAGVSLSLSENLPWYGDAADVAVRLALRVNP